MIVVALLTSVFGIGLVKERMQNEAREK